MAEYILKNEEIQIKVDSHGAELRAVTDVKNGKDYMWNADPAFWGRVSPILFPVVGSYKDGESRYQGQTYKMSQHGFARDMEFDLKEQTADTLWFSLKDNEATKEKYPFAFLLELGYKISGRSVKVLWRVTNPAEETMYFSIGGHPAFLAPLREADKITCYISFEGVNSIKARKLFGGLASDTVVEIPLEEGGILPVTEEVFADDALIIENNQTGKVALLDADKKPYLTVNFTAPLFGVWTPPSKNAPFICIEPWYGRCDKVDFAGTLAEREWGNTLKGGEVFEAEYSIEV